MRPFRASTDGHQTVAEHEVMWIGRRPAAMAPAEHAATTEAFAEAVTTACAACDHGAGPCACTGLDAGLAE